MLRRLLRRLNGRTDRDEWLVRMQSSGVGPSAVAHLPDDEDHRASALQFAQAGVPPALVAKFTTVAVDGHRRSGEPLDDIVIDLAATAGLLGQYDDPFDLYVVGRHFRTRYAHPRTRQEDDHR